MDGKDFGLSFLAVFKMRYILSTKKRVGLAFSAR
jgi:hypothetical protein